MKRILRFLVIIIGIALLLCACSKGKQADSTETAGGTQGETSADEALLDLEKYSLQPQEGTDDNPSLFWRYIAASEKGYYFWNASSKLMFYDISSGISVPLCNRPDCSHTDSDCNAYFIAILGEDTEEDRFLTESFLQFVDGYLYILGIDTKDYVSLYKVAADGSTREKCMRLYKADFSSPSGDSSEMEFRDPEACIHRGYLYWIDSTATPLCIHRMKLGGGTDEVIYTEEGENPNTYRLEGYGDFVFFQSGHFVDEGYSMEGGIYAYNIQTGEVQLALDGAISFYTLRGEQIYYTTETGVSKYDLTTGKTETIVENGIAYPDMSVDERYLYCYDEEENMLIAYEHDGTKVAEIVDEEVSQFFGTDSKHLFSSRGEELQDDETEWAILPIDDVESGNAKWTNLN